MLLRLCLGDALIRNPASLINVNQKMVNSTLHSVFATGAQAGEGIQIQNPDYQGSSASESPTLTGAAAYLRIVSNSIAGTGYAATGSTNPLLQLLDLYKKGKWVNGKTAGSVGDFGGPMIKHGDVSYIFNPDAPTLGSRPIALIADLTEEEKAFYIERGTLLNSTIPHDALINGFDFDIPNSWSNGKVSSGTQTQFENVPPDEYGKYLSSNVINAPQQKAFVCTALIELLLCLVDKISINGGFGLERAVVSETTANSGGINGASANITSGTAALSDHVFGRAFDIQYIGRTQDSSQKISINSAEYEVQLDTLLEALSTVPMPLLPDLIVIHPEVGRKIGVAEGLESMDTAVKMKYPNLKYVNFHFDDNHDDHIHISFSGARAGMYIGSSGLITTTQAGDGDGSDVDAGVEAALQSGLIKAKTSYKNDPEGSLSLVELFAMLREKYFTDEAAAIMCAVSGRESNLRPGSFNGKCKVNSSGSWGGDYSFGMFQINLIAQMNRKGNSSTSFSIIYDGEKDLSPAVTYKASHLAYKPGADSKWSDNKIGQKMVELQNEGKKDTSDLIWYPINQVSMLATGKFSYNNSPINTSAGFYAWGDYNNSDGTPRSVCGFIFGTKFQDAVSVYLTTGKDIGILEDWVRKNLPKYNKRTTDYIEQWMSGAVFYPKEKNGSLIQSTKAIKYIAAGSSGDTSSGSTVRKITENIAIIGDYLIQESSEKINSKITRTPWSSYKVSGANGRNLTTSGSNTTITSVVKAIKDMKEKDGFTPDAYIIAAGSVLTYLSATATSYSSAIKQVMTEIGNKPTLWFRVYNASNNTDISRSTLFNNELDKVSESNTNLLKNSITEWDNTVISNISYLSPTKRGLSDLGKEAFSDLVEQAANTLAAMVSPGSYVASSSGSVPTFTATQILDAAIWLRENRMADWLASYDDGDFGCEGFANRLSCGLGILGATKNYALFTDPWPKEIPTTLTTHASAQAHYNAIKNKSIFFGPSTEKGKNPPAGYLVFWTGGTGDNANLGHVGISLGDGKYIDQNTGSPYAIAGSTVAGGFPGTNYKYAGSSSAWT